ncbi:MAG: helix-turn-helix domain-containing protein [Candidatus Diapherotrites archaeon]|nr:helix-turn-helix domain-containing protein [Candidatus Diapherotrites archaeon]
MREHLLLKLVQILQHAHFEVSTFLQSDNCFDLIAKKQGLLLVVKVYSNIDGIRPEQASELKRMASLFNAHCIIVGQHSKAFELQEGTLYDRYGIPVVSTKTFEWVLASKEPFSKYFKGKNIVELDAEKLRRMRIKKKLTLNELAHYTGSSTESIHRYEKGFPATIETAHKLEHALSTQLIQGFDLFKNQDLEKPEKNETMHIEDTALEKIHELGLKLSVFDHAPFKAVSLNESILISKGKKKNEIRRKAELLKRTRTLFHTDSLIVASEEVHVKSVDGTPVIEEKELDSLSKAKDLIQLLRERKKEGRT